MESHPFFSKTVFNPSSVNQIRHALPVQPEPVREWGHHQYNSVILVRLYNQIWALTLAVLLMAVWQISFSELQFPHS